MNIYLVNIKKTAAFTLVELIIVIAIITLLAGIVVVTLNPVSIFTGSRNSQRANDLSSIQSAINRYIGDSTINGSSRSLADFSGYTNLVSDAVGGNAGACANGVNEIPTGTTITGSYDINVSGTYFVDISLLLNNGYLPKVPKDPATSNYYQACIDINNNNSLVIFSPNSEGAANLSTAFFTNIEGPSTNLISNPSMETNISVWGPTNATANRVSSGATGTFRTYGTYYMQVTPTNSSYAQTQISPSNWFAGRTYTFSITIDKGTYSAPLLLEIKDSNGSYVATTLSITISGRYSITRTLRSDATAFKVGVSATGGTGSYYLDGAQVEEKSTATSYIDGSLGSNYTWNGTAHASTSNRIK